MALTPEQNAQFNLMRNQLLQMMTALTQLARQVGADPIPLNEEGMPAFSNPLPPAVPEPPPEEGGRRGMPGQNPIKYYEAPGVVNGIRVKPAEPQVTLASAMAIAATNAAEQPPPSTPRPVFKP